MLSDGKRADISGRLRATPHLEIMRIGSRMPCVFPARITPSLCDTLKQFHPLFMNVHFNLPRAKPRVDQGPRDDLLFEAERRACLRLSCRSARLA